MIIKKKNFNFFFFYNIADELKLKLSKRHSKIEDVKETDTKDNGQSSTEHDSCSKRTGSSIDLKEQHNKDTNQDQQANQSNTEPNSTHTNTTTTTLNSNTTSTVGSNKPEETDAKIAPVDEIAERQKKLQCQLQEELKVALERRKAKLGKRSLAETVKGMEDDTFWEIDTDVFKYRNEKETDGTLNVSESMADEVQTDSEQIADAVLETIERIQDHEESYGDQVSASAAVETAVRGYVKSVEQQKLDARTAVKKSKALQDDIEKNDGQVADVVAKIEQQKMTGQVTKKDTQYTHDAQILQNLTKTGKVATYKTGRTFGEVRKSPRIIQGSKSYLFKNRRDHSSRELVSMKKHSVDKLNVQIAGTVAKLAEQLEAVHRQAKFPQKLEKKCNTGDLERKDDKDTKVAENDGEKQFNIKNLAQKFENTSNKQKKARDSLVGRPLKKRTSLIKGNKDSDKSTVKKNESEKMCDNNVGGVLKLTRKFETESNKGNPNTAVNGCEIDLEISNDSETYNTDSSDKLNKQLFRHTLDAKLKRAFQNAQNIDGSPANDDKIQQKSNRQKDGQRNIRTLGKCETSKMKIRVSSETRETSSTAGNVIPVTPNEQKSTTSIVSNVTSVVQNAENKQNAKPNCSRVKKSATIEKHQNILKFAKIFEGNKLNHGNDLQGKETQVQMDKKLDNANIRFTKIFDGDKVNHESDKEVKETQLQSESESEKGDCDGSISESASQVSDTHVERPDNVTKILEMFEKNFNKTITKQGAKQLGISKTKDGKKQVDNSISKNGLQIEDLKENCVNLTNRLQLDESMSDKKTKATEKTACRNNNRKIETWDTEKCNEKDINVSENNCERTKNQDEERDSFEIHTLKYQSIMSLEKYRKDEVFDKCTHKFGSCTSTAKKCKSETKMDVVSDTSAKELNCDSDKIQLENYRNVIPLTRKFVSDMKIAGRFRKVTDGHTRGNQNNFNSVNSCTSDTSSDRGSFINILPTQSDRYLCRADQLKKVRDTKFANRSLSKPTDTLDNFTDEENASDYANSTPVQTESESKKFIPQYESNTAKRVRKKWDSITYIAECNNEKVVRENHECHTSDSKQPCHNVLAKCKGIKPNDDLKQKVSDTETSNSKKTAVNTILASEMKGTKSDDDHNIKYSVMESSALSTAGQNKSISLDCCCTSLPRDKDKTAQEETEDLTNYVCEGTTSLTRVKDDTKLNQNTQRKPSVDKYDKHILKQKKCDNNTKKSEKNIKVTEKGNHVEVQDKKKSNSFISTKTINIGSDTLSHHSEKKTKEETTNNNVQKASQGYVTVMKEMESNLRKGSKSKIVCDRNVESEDEKNIRSSFESDTVSTDTNDTKIPKEKSNDTLRFCSKYYAELEGNCPPRAKKLEGGAPIKKEKKIKGIGEKISETSNCHKTVTNDFENDRTTDDNNVKVTRCEMSNCKTDRKVAESAKTRTGSYSSVDEIEMPLGKNEMKIVEVEMPFGESDMKIVDSQRTINQGDVNIGEIANDGNPLDIDKELPKCRNEINNIDTEMLKCKNDLNIVENDIKIEESRSASLDMEIKNCASENRRKFLELKPNNSSTTIRRKTLQSKYDEAITRKDSETGNSSIIKRGSSRNLKKKVKSDENKTRKIVTEEEKKNNMINLKKKYITEGRVGKSVTTRSKVDTKTLERYKKLQDSDLNKAESEARKNDLNRRGKSSRTKSNFIETNIEKVSMKKPVDAEEKKKSGTNKIDAKDCCANNNTYESKKVDKNGVMRKHSHTVRPDEYDSPKMSKNSARKNKMNTNELESAYRRDSEKQKMGNEKCSEYLQKPNVKEVTKSWEAKIQKYTGNNSIRKNVTDTRQTDENECTQKRYQTVSQRHENDLSKSENDVRKREARNETNRKVNERYGNDNGSSTGKEDERGDSLIDIEQMAYEESLMYDSADDIDDLVKMNDFESEESVTQETPINERTSLQSHDEASRLDQENHDFPELAYIKGLISKAESKAKYMDKLVQSMNKHINLKEAHGEKKRSRKKTDAGDKKDKHSKKKKSKSSKVSESSLESKVPTDKVINSTADFKSKTLGEGRKPNIKVTAEKRIPLTPRYNSTKDNDSSGPTVSQADSKVTAECESTNRDKSMCTEEVSNQGGSGESSVESKKFPAKSIIQFEHLTRDAKSEETFICRNKKLEDFKNMLTVSESDFRDKNNESHVPADNGRNVSRYFTCKDLTEERPLSNNNSQLILSPSCFDPPRTVRSNIVNHCTFEVDPNSEDKHGIECAQEKFYSDWLKSPMGDNKGTNKSLPSERETTSTSYTLEDTEKTSEGRTSDNESEKKKGHVLKPLKTMDKNLIVGWY